MSTLLRACFLDQHSLDRADLDIQPLHAGFDELTVYGETPPGRIVERLQNIEAVITNKVVIDEAVMAACPDLRLILVAATGFNNIDIDAARQRGITVCNCQGYGTSSVAQHCLMLLLALATRLPDYQRDIRNGHWQTAHQFCLLSHPVVELHGKTLGILGYGELGQAVARLAEAFGMNTMIGQLPGRPAQDRLPLTKLLPQVDALTLHCPLNERTRNLLGRDQLQLMKPGAFLINTARGGLVDEQALADCLRSGHLGGAACDVLSEEPPRHGNPLLAPDIPRLILTPHIAWSSREARQRIIDQLAENALAYRRGAACRTVQ